MSKSEAERLGLDELGERRQALWINPCRASGTCREMDVITAQAQSFRRERAYPCLVIQRVGDAAPDEVLFNFVPERCRELKLRHPRGDWLVARDLDTAKIMVSGQGREPVPGLCDAAALSAQIANEARRFQLREELHKNGVVDRLRADLASGCPASKPRKTVLDPVLMHATQKRSPRAVELDIGGLEHRLQARHV
jgi:hypothetical protein